MKDQNDKVHINFIHHLKKLLIINNLTINMLLLLKELYEQLLNL